MTNKLNRSDYLILDTLHGSNMTDQFHSMTIEEIMEETGNVLGVRMTVYRMVTKLVKLGYLEKGVMDNHANTYYLTNDGRKLFNYICENIGIIHSKHNKELEYEKRRKVVDLINIYEGKFNKIGMKIGKTNPLSKNWYESKRKSNLFMLEQLKANTENFFRTVSKTNSEDNMYTVFKSYTKYIKGKGYSKGFVPCNARGTNEFKDKKALAYLVNFFMSPEIRQFVNHYDLIFDEDMCSLSALLQWMWRSQIRNGKPIDIYIPSERMRELLNNWIQNCYVTEKAA